MNLDLKELQNKLNYIFKDESLLLKSLSHKSFLNEAKEDLIESNERLEFLGDAVLDLVISTILINEFQNADEGVLSKMKAKVVREPALAKVSRCLDLGKYLLLGKGEELNYGREKNSLLANMLEAIIAAIYLDSDLLHSEKFIKENFTELIDELRTSDSSDYKTRLQEVCQTNQYGIPIYALLREYGPDHQKIFEIKLFINKITYSIGIAKTKKEAEQNAARITIEKLALRKREI